jgi:hypothetical protein
MHDFGMLYWSLGIVGDTAQQEESLRLLEKSYMTRKTYLGDNNPETLESINSIGTILTSLDKFKEAEPLLRAALTGRKQVFGLQHLSVADSDHSCAICLMKQRRYDESKLLLEEEITIRTSVLGVESPLVQKAVDAIHKLMAVAS